MFIQCHLVFMTVYKWLPSRKLKESSAVHTISTDTDTDTQTQTQTQTDTHTHRGNVDYFTCNFEYLHGFHQTGLLWCLQILTPFSEHFLHCHRLVHGSSKRMFLSMVQFPNNNHLWSSQSNTQ